MADYERIGRTDDSQRRAYPQNNSNALFGQNLLSIPTDRSHPLRGTPQEEAGTRQSLPGRTPTQALGGQESLMPTHDRRRTRDVPAQPVQQPMSSQFGRPSATSTPDFYAARNRNHSTAGMPFQTMQSGAVGPPMVPISSPNFIQSRLYQSGSMQQQQQQQQSQLQQKQQQQRRMSQLSNGSETVLPGVRTNHSTQRQQVHYPPPPSIFTPQDTSQAVSGSHATAKQASSKPVKASLSMDQTCFNMCRRFDRPLILYTRSPSYFPKSAALTGGIGASSGVTAIATATKTFERDPGKTLKASILEAMQADPWPEINVSHMDELHGVMVSLCTSNACRKTLWEVCSSEYVVSHLEQYMRDDRKQTFDEFKSLTDEHRNHTFVQAWAQLQRTPRESRTKISALITSLRCLVSLLADSGYRDGGLVVWTPSEVTNGNNARLLKCEWTRFIEDTADSACFAVTTPQKYVFKQGPTVLPIGVRCNECSSEPLGTNPAFYTQITFAPRTGKQLSFWKTLWVVLCRPVKSDEERFLTVGNNTLYFCKYSEDDLKGCVTIGNRTRHASEARAVKFLAGTLYATEYNSEQYQERRNFLQGPLDSLDVFLVG